MAEFADTTADDNPVVARVMCLSTPAAMADYGTFANKLDIGSPLGGTWDTYNNVGAEAFPGPLSIRI